MGCRNAAPLPTAPGRPPQKVRLSNAGFAVGLLRDASRRRDTRLAGKGWENVGLEELSLIPAADVAGAIDALRLRTREPIEGITVLGGEPTDRIEPLTHLLTSARAMGLSTIVYTGYTIEALTRKYGARAKALLAQTDLLKDGPFREDRYRADLEWRGSENQRLHCLTDRYTPEMLAAAFREQGKGYSILLAASECRRAQRREALAADRATRGEGTGPPRRTTHHWGIHRKLR